MPCLLSWRSCARRTTVILRDRSAWAHQAPRTVEGWVRSDYGTSISRNTHAVLPCVHRCIHRDVFVYACHLRTGPSGPPKRFRPSARRTWVGRAIAACRGFHGVRIPPPRRSLGEPRDPSPPSAHAPGGCTRMLRGASSLLARLLQGDPARKVLFTLADPPPCPLGQVPKARCSPALRQQAPTVGVCSALGLYAAGGDPRAILPRTSQACSQR